MNKADGRIDKGGGIMLIEGIVVVIAMAMYIGAEWTAEDVLK